MSTNAPDSGFKIKFSNREVSAWGGMALLKRMLDQMDFRQAATGWDLPPPGSNRGYPPAQLIDRYLVRCLSLRPCRNGAL